MTMRKVDIKSMSGEIKRFGCPNCDNVLEIDQDNVHRKMIIDCDVCNDRVMLSLKSHESLASTYTRDRKAKEKKDKD